MTDSYKAILEDALALLKRSEELSVNQISRSALDLIKRKQDLEADAKQHHSLEAAPLVVEQPKLKM